MATTTGPDASVKRRTSAAGDAARVLVRAEIEELARQGARQVLTAALNDGVDADPLCNGIAISSRPRSAASVPSQ